MKGCTEPPEFVLEWCRRLGANPDLITPLQGGINNQVFRCYANGQALVLKGYVSDRADSYERFIAEVGFLRYANEIATEFVPLLLHSDETTQSVVLEYLEGELFKEGAHLSQEDIDQAVSFMYRLNADPAAARVKIVKCASEGFLCLTEHLQNVNERIAEMGSDHLPTCLQGQAKGAIHALERQYEKLQIKIEQIILEGECEDALKLSERCVSPSDFGFHNAIRTRTGVKFFDFDFAGWDDPAKTVADFDLQPRVPVGQRTLELRSGIPLWSVSLEARCETLFPILQLKWACIILSVLNSNRWAQIAQIVGSDALERLVQSKLQLAQTYIGKD